MKIKHRLFALVMAVILCMSSLSVTAFAYGDDPDPDYEIIVPTEAPPETEPSRETQPPAATQPPAETTPTEPVEIIPGTGFYNDGNVTTRDLLYDEHTNKQFISIETRTGDIFYIVIDYDKPIDEEANLYETYFLNMVDAADLEALLENGSAPAACSCTERCIVGEVNALCEICAADRLQCVGMEPETEPTVPETEPVEEPKEKGGSGAGVALILLLGLGGGGAYYYLKLRKPDQKTKGDTDLDEYDYGMDDDEEYADFEESDEMEDNI